MLRERSKNFLAMHVILGGGLLGITLAIVGLLLNFTNIFEPLEDFVGLFKLDQVPLLLLLNLQLQRCGRLERFAK
jgi:hypothetical protein